MSDFNIERMEQELEHVLGDADTTRLATGGVAELLKAAGEAGAGYQAKKESAAKSKSSEADMAVAQQAQIDAQLAAMDAAAEKDPYGPKHKDAVVKAAKAQQAMAKVGMSGALFPGGQPGQPSSGGSFMTRRSAGLPNYAWVVGGTLVGGGVIALIVKFFSRKGK